MDNVCHTLVGVAMAKAGLERRSGLALPVLALGANLPDVDVLAMLVGEGLAFRRGWTHGVVALVFLPALFVSVLALWARYRHRGMERTRVRLGWLWFMATLATATHLVLDWMNSYGVRLLMPLSERWFYGDSLFIVDPWILLSLGGGVLLATRKKRKGPALWALALVAVYSSANVWMTSSARKNVARLLRSQRIETRTLVVDAVPLDPLARRVIVSDGMSYCFARVRWPHWTLMHPLGEPLPIEADTPWARAAAALPEGRRFLKWARVPFFALGEEPGTVYIADARYARRARASWAAILVRIDSGLVERRVQATEGASYVRTGCARGGAGLPERTGGTGGG
ncbi:MAG TPA: metal-dependent hydrolase [Gemmatimonadaceae bacterium]|nr:metal-dependent hydrolase [Gemmatimonadaceae bacterium]